MFEQLPSGKSRKWWTIPLAVLGEILIIGILILIPLFYTQVLPTPELVAALTLPPPPLPPPPPAPPAAAHPMPRHVETQPRVFKLNTLVAPKVIPKETVIGSSIEPQIADNAGVPGGVPGGIPGGVVGGTVGGVFGGVAAAAPPPPPPPPAPKAAPQPARLAVGGQVQAAKLIHEVMPQFPRMAHEARIAGVVRLKAVIAKDGTVEDLSVISGHPFLVPAALDAVKQWVYKPTFLNGKPIEVSTEVDVTFTLAS